MPGPQEQRRKAIAEILFGKANPRGKAVFAPFYPQVEAQSRKIFGGGDQHYGNESAIGMDIMDMINDMPLVSVLMFQQSALTMPAEEMVDRLLMQVHGMEKE